MNIKKILIKFKIEIFIVVMSLVPVFHTWGRLVIGGDTIIPFSSSSLVKYLYQWVSTQNGIYFSINYYPLYFFYRVLELFTSNVYIISSVMLFLLSFLAGYGIYKLTSLFYDKKNSYLYIIPVLFYLFSPALLNGWRYLYFYSFAPWFIFFIFKFIKDKKIGTVDLIWLSIILFFSSLDIPNPKYVFHLFLVMLIAIIFSKYLKLIEISFIFKNWKKLVIFMLLSMYLLLPLGYFSTHYSPEDYNIHVKAGYKDVGKMMDSGSAIVSKMTRLYHDGVNLNKEEREGYLSNKFIIILSYSYIFLIITNLFFRKEKSETYRYEIIFFVLIVIYLFLAVGPNPPFGFIYEYIVEHVSLLGFLRTTAGAVFLLSIFYAVSLFILLKNISSRNKLITGGLITLAIIITGYPLFNGEFYKNSININKHANKENHGFKIPDEYLRIKNLVNTQKLDAKTFYSQTGSSYISTDWGYFGPPFYYFLYNDYPISLDKIYSNFSNHNVGFIFEDNSIFAFEDDIDVDEEEKRKKDFIEFKVVDEDQFLPHFYTPEKTIISGRDLKGFENIFRQRDYSVRSAVFLKNQINNKEHVLNSLDKNENLPVLEFKKINPTKYRIRVHQANGKFPLVFSEKFHHDWKIYLAKPRDKTSSNSIESKKILNNYKILDNNKKSQASISELKNYVKNGWVTDLGSFKERDIRHTKWEGAKEKLDYIEKYKIDFVSKKFHGTIQNNNLPNGKSYETWFAAKPSKGDGRNMVQLSNESHLKVNGYANSWIIDTEKICNENPGFCKENPSGTKNFEIIAEFWPQRIFYAGLYVSGTSFLACLAYLAYSRKKRHTTKCRDIRK